jgi:hypothetical protein
MDGGLRRRFEAKVDRSGEHHRWNGAAAADGTGMVKVGGKPMAARRLAWELANGPLPHGARVECCPHDPACVRAEHLSVAGVVGREAPKRKRAHVARLATASGSCR